ncbi:serine protease 53-like isoform X1 [Pelodiscus sinensis]|uniref:serine protease 53-like isoform X1 n=1 Tax=Pelodiscus sinensis TaxID=13735 RepID=UPI003F6C563C
MRPRPGLPTQAPHPCFLSLTGLQQGAAAAGPACGQQRVLNRIVGGTNAQRGEWPWQASLQLRGEHLCGGTLIGDKWILSAAHCFIGKDTTKDPAAWKVVLGRLQLSGGPLQGVVRNVSQIITHEKYQDYTQGMDIALLRLAEPVPFGRDVAPICLPYPSHQFAFGSQCWATGWGRVMEDRTLPPPMPLKKVELDLLSAETCNCIHSNLRQKELSSPARPGLICAGFQSGGVGPCQGDSGGPVVCSENGTWFQAGILSFSVGCARPHSPILITEVTAYASWIKNRTGGASFAVQTGPAPFSSEEGKCKGCGKPKGYELNFSATGAWPWYVSLQFGGQHVCGGALISESWVLAAAHCFIERQEHTDWKVLLGERREGAEPRWQEERGLRKLILHGAFVNVTEGSDIALLQLAQPVGFGEHLWAICLPYETHRFRLGGTCWARGREKARAPTPQPLQGVGVALVGPVACNCSYNQSILGGEAVPILPEMLCAAQQEETTSCEGDDGGALICSEKGTWFLAGLSSFSNGCGRKSQPGVYTDVRAHEKWIMDITRDGYFANQPMPVPAITEEDTCPVEPTPSSGGAGTKPVPTVGTTSGQGSSGAGTEPVPTAGTTKGQGSGGAGTTPVPTAGTTKGQGCGGAGTKPVPTAGTTKVQGSGGAGTKPVPTAGTTRGQGSTKGWAKPEIPGGATEEEGASGKGQKPRPPGGAKGGHGASGKGQKPRPPGGAKGGQGGKGKGPKGRLRFF